MADHEGSSSVRADRYSARSVQSADATFPILNCVLPLENRASIITVTCDDVDYPQRIVSAASGVHVGVGRVHGYRGSAVESLSAVDPVPLNGT